MLRCCVETGRLVDNRLADFVEVAVRVCGFVPGGTMGFFVEYRIFVTVDCGVDSCSHLLACNFSTLVS